MGNENWTKKHWKQKCPNNNCVISHWSQDHSKSSYLTFRLRRVPGLVGEGLERADFPADCIPEASLAAPEGKKQEIKVSFYCWCHQWHHHDGEPNNSDLETWSWKGSWVESCWASCRFWEEERHETLSLCTLERVERVLAGPRDLWPYTVVAEWPARKNIHSFTAANHWPMSIVAP